MKGFANKAIVLMPNKDITLYWSGMEWRNFNEAIQNLVTIFDREFGIACHMFQSALPSGEDGELRPPKDLLIVKTVSYMDEVFVNDTVYRVLPAQIEYPDHDKEAVKAYPPTPRGISEIDRGNVMFDRCLFTEKYLTKAYYKIIVDLQFNKLRRVPVKPQKDSGVMYLPFDKHYRCTTGYIGDQSLQMDKLSPDIDLKRPLLSWR